VMAGVAGGIGIDVKLLLQGHGQAGLFLRFPDGGRLDRFPVIDKPARQSPAGGGDSSF
jgi:hypothetical protein